MTQEDSTFIALYKYTNALAVALEHRDLLTRLYLMQLFRKIIESSKFKASTN